MTELFQLACDGAREMMPADITAVMETRGRGRHPAACGQRDGGAGRPGPPDRPRRRADHAGRDRAARADPDRGHGDARRPRPDRDRCRHPLRAGRADPAPRRRVRRDRRYAPLRPCVHTDDRAFLQSIANVLGAAIGRVRDEEAMRRAALHDPLTGLPNRTLLLDRLETALARCPQGEPRVAVLTCDFDGFARINEQAGHAIGDEVLRTAATRIAELLEPRDTLTRASGDEFVVIREDADGPGDAGALGKRLLDALSAPYEVDGRVLPSRQRERRHGPARPRRRPRGRAARRRHCRAPCARPRSRPSRDLRRVDARGPARPARAGERPAPDGARPRAAAALHAAGLAGGGLDRRLRGAGALGASGARAARPGRVHRRRRAHRGDPRDRPLGDRAGVP